MGKRILKNWQIGICNWSFDGRWSGRSNSKRNTRKKTRSSNVQDERTPLIPKVLTGKTFCLKNRIWLVWLPVHSGVKGIETAVTSGSSTLVTDRNHSCLIDSACLTRIRLQGANQCRSYAMGVHIRDVFPALDEKRAVAWTHSHNKSRIYTP